MPCAKCKSDFNLLNWKLRCIDCGMSYCSKCLKKAQGAPSGLSCDKCCTLNKRPPDRERLMELRSKDLRDYLNRNHVSTHGLVEKAELVELFFRRTIPPHNSRKGNRFSSVFSESVPNLVSDTQIHLNAVCSNVEANISNVRSLAENAIHNLGRAVAPEAPVPQSCSSRAESHGFQEPNQTNFDNEHAEQQPAASVQKRPKLSDFARADDLSDLSVKQLKELLTLNRVNYKGCVEKRELLERATRLWWDNNAHKQDADDAPVENLCKICMDAPLDCVILECGHMATCIDCGKQLAECPICRQFVTRIVRTFKA